MKRRPKRSAAIPVTRCTAPPLTPDNFVGRCLLDDGHEEAHQALGGRRWGEDLGSWPLRDLPADRVAKVAQRMLVAAVLAEETMCRQAMAAVIVERAIDELARRLGRRPPRRTSTPKRKPPRAPKS